MRLDRPRSAALLAIASAVSLGSGPLSAQAVCAAPHSSPTLSGLGIGLVPPGAGWVQVTVYHGASTEFFGPDGRARPFLADARTSASSVFVTAAAGIVRGLEAWVQLPVHRLTYTDQTGELSRAGLGDPRLSVRAGGALVGLTGVPVTLRAGIKLPGSDFPVDPNLLPISEGQTDIELALEVGRVLTGAYPVHVGGWVGYRRRLENRARARKPGDELIGRFGAGGPLGAIRWDLSFEGLWGKPPELQGYVIEGARRRLLQVLPTLGARIAAVEVEVTARVSLSGRNLPAGPSLSVGVLLPWMLP